MDLYINTRTGEWGKAEELVMLDEEASNLFREKVDTLSDSQIAEFPSTLPRP